MKWMTIAFREWRALFRSPLAWVIAAAMQLVFAYLFLLALEDYIDVQSELQSSPVSATAMVMGKFAGVLLFVVVLIILMVAMPFSLILVSGIDLKTLSLATLGVVCLASAATAVGLYFSTLSQHSMVAALCSVATLLFLWLLGKGSFSHPWVVDALTALAISAHLGNFFQGIFDTKEIGYFAIITAAFLALAINRIDAQRQLSNQ